MGLMRLQPEVVYAILDLRRPMSELSRTTTSLSIVGLCIGVLGLCQQSTGDLIVNAPGAQQSCCNQERGKYAMDNRYIV